MQSGAARFSRNRRRECGPISVQVRGEALCFLSTRRSELSAQVRPQSSYAYFSQVFSEGVPMAPRRKLFVVR